MDVGEWLRGLGLGQYEPAFRENEIDAEVLPKLTSEDLKEIGVVIVGHRRKLFPAAETAERRPLTVMLGIGVGSLAPIAGPFWRGVSFNML